MKNKIIIAILFSIFVVGFFILTNRRQDSSSAINEPLDQKKIKTRPARLTIYCPRACGKEARETALLIK